MTTANSVFIHIQMDKKCRRCISSVASFFVQFQTFKAIPDLVAATPELSNLQENLQESVLDSVTAGSKGLQQREISAALLKAENNINAANQSL